MTSFSRADASVLGWWWWTIDRWTLVALGIIIILGAFLNMSASPAVAERIGSDSYFFIRKHLQLMPITLFLLLGTSLLSPKAILKGGFILFFVSLIGVYLTLYFGVEIKGARRWLSIPGFSLQPSEFLKPGIAIVIAWFLSLRHEDIIINPKWLAFGAVVISLIGLLAQPDIGMSAILITIWVVQLFLAGLPFRWIFLLGILGIGGLGIAYIFLPHVTARIDKFLDPSSSDSYQVGKAIEAFTSGGLMGVGPGEGRVKDYLPDSHADTIFAVLGEELGLIPTLMCVALFAFVILRGFYLLRNEQNLFIVMAVTGLYTQFGIQAFVNMASTLSLIPTKGMTLPFVSYGGSSMFAIAIGVGMALALTRRNFKGPKMPKIHEGLIHSPRTTPSR